MNNMNEKSRVLAVRHLDFKDDNGQPINGYQVWLAIPTTDKSWLSSEEVCKAWVSNADPNAQFAAALIPGDIVAVSFNRRGKPFISSYVG